MTGELQMWSGSSRLSKAARAAAPRPPATGSSAGRRRLVDRCSAIVAAFAFCYWIAGCAQGEYEQAVALSQADQSEVSFGRPDSVPDELREMEFTEVNAGAGTEHLGAARMLRRSGVFEFLESYIINIPPSALFLSDKELHTATHFNERSGRTDEATSASMLDFEHRVLVGAYGAQADLWQDLMERAFAEEDDGSRDEADPAMEPGALHDAFFAALEQCGRDSPWPEVELFVMGQGFAGDYLPQFVESDFDISYFEYRELLHLCGRYAASYPTLDPETRDELLAPQRAHYATVILDLLDNQLPVLEVPPKYQAEIDNLRENGW